MNDPLLGTRHKVGDILTKYGSVLGMIPGAEVFGKPIEALAKILSESSLEEQHTRIFDVMKNAQRTIVVLIDDLDRLDRDEMIMMLKVVRHTASVPHIVYLLAFDDDMVAQSLNSAYGGNPNSGRQFLEKIIQLPFAIPAIGQRRLVNYVLRRARDACEKGGVTVNDHDWAVFRGLIDRCLSRRLTTPRQAIRFGSALDFALPMLKGEVDPLQQMVLEGLRILFSTLYVRVRDNSSLFTGTLSKQEITEQVELTLSKGDESAVAAANLLEFLFVTSRSLPRSISDPRYFGAIEPEGTLDAIVTQLAVREPTQLVEFLSDQLQILSEAQSLRLAKALASCGQVFAKHQLVEEGNRRTAFLELLVELLRLGARDDTMAAEERRDAAAEIVSCLQPLDLAGAFVRMLLELNATSRVRKDIIGLGLPERIIEPESWPVLHDALVPRIRAFADANPAELFIDGADGWDLFNDWRRYHLADLREWLEKLLYEEPAYAVPLLRGLVENSIIMDSRFETIKATITPTVVLNALITHLGSIIIDRGSIIRVDNQHNQDIWMARHFLHECERRGIFVAPSTLER